MRLALAIVLLAACDFPTPSEQYACRVTADCESDRVCEQGYCVIGASGHGPDAANTLAPDAAVTADAPPDADPFAAIAAQCVTAGYTMSATAGGYYRPVATTTSWQNAETDCINDVPGATHLIVLSRQSEVTYMASQLGWIGLSDRAVEGQFVTVTGETGDVRPWASGQPDNGGGNENCAQMKTGGTIDDDQCGNPHKYVCECDGHMGAAP
jgi:hypothetical protein